MSAIGPRKEREREKKTHIQVINADASAFKICKESLKVLPKYQILYCIIEMWTCQELKLVHSPQLGDTTCM